MFDFNLFTLSVQFETSLLGLKHFNKTFKFILISWSNPPTLTTTTITTKGVSRSQPVSPAPRTPTSKLSVSIVRRPASSDGLRRLAESNVAELRHNGVTHNQESNGMRHNIQDQRQTVSASRPFFKVKSDSSLPTSPSLRQAPPSMRQLRHRVTVNGIPTLNVTPSAQRSLSSASLIPAIAPLADIAEHSTDIDLNRIRIGESVADQQRRRFDPPRLMINEGRKSLSMTKIAEKPIYLAEPHIRRNASWTTMTAALNS